MGLTVVRCSLCGGTIEMGVRRGDGGGTWTTVRLRARILPSSRVGGGVGSMTTTARPRSTMAPEGLFVQNNHDLPSTYVDAVW